MNPFKSRKKIFRRKIGDIANFKNQTVWPHLSISWSRWAKAIIWEESRCSPSLWVHHSDSDRNEPNYRG